MTPPHSHTIAPDPSTTHDRGTWGRTLLNKVPQVTMLFWVVKILSTTVGETAADFLNTNVGLGLSATTALMAALLAIALAVQLSTEKYIPSVYWLVVVLISVVGTLFSDNLVDNLGVSLWISSAIFGLGLIVSFTAWYRSEGTLSIHTIVTRRREAFYWLTILFTFALGTSAGDLVAEKLAVGYFPSVLIFGGVIAAITAVFFSLRTNAVIAFWAAYIITRPFGASMGDFLTAPTNDGALGIGTNGTSALFLAVIVGCVAWFTIKIKRDELQLGTD